MITSKEIRSEFLKFFKGKAHKIVPSAPLIPPENSNLLFTIAGMNQFEGIFLGREKPEHPRVANSQKCIRVSGKHNDLEEVGRDTYHHTFFEMLGNWSFGDYYKKEAIEMAWELLTVNFRLPKDRLWATVFKDDDEAEILWKKVTDINPDRILRFDERENFWEMGETGPCGPCSEIHIDLGEGRCEFRNDRSHICGVNGGCGRFVELWNLVFIQFNRDAQGELHTLPDKHVDTGMGLERLTAVLQDRDSNYATDLFAPIMGEIAHLTGCEMSAERAVPFRVIADHIRALSFAIADGILPSNEGRGYVLRRILRRAARFGRNLNMHEPFIYKLVGKVGEIMGEAYPEVLEKAEHISLVIKSEEESFGKTLDRGIELFEEIAHNLERRGERCIPGRDAFRLYDTYGFPLDLTELMARERGMSVDTRGFQDEMEGQRIRSREASRIGAFATEEEAGEIVSIGDFTTEFVGYTQSRAKGKVVKAAKGDDTVTIYLDRTPFYAEAGGQVGDSGTIEGDRFTLDVSDTRRDQAGLIQHIGKLARGTFEDIILGGEVEASVDPKRESTKNNHTATHILQSAMREILGTHIQQAGSYVDHERLRFDFTHYEAIKREDLKRIEALVNRRIREAAPVRAEVMPIEEARRTGAIALFGEKYGEKVRVVSIGDFSKELCGGTHVDNTGNIGFFKILSEGSIAAGVRRIEAVTGEAAVRYVQEIEDALTNAASSLNVGRDKVEERIEALLARNKEMEKEIGRMKEQVALGKVEDILKDARSVNGVRVVTGRVDGLDRDSLASLLGRIRERVERGIVVLATSQGDRALFLASVSDDLTSRYHAGNIAREVAKIAGGGGGGKPNFAQAGGKDVSKIDDALRKVYDIVKS
ncbi:MAG: alanine--tRNA ligase [bacterium]